MKYRHILIIFKKSHDEARNAARTVADWLEKRHCQAILWESGPEALDGDMEIDCAVALGGDGTILGLARKLAGRRTPVFGINFGRVGFLTAADSDNWKDRLESALDGHMAVKRCLALKWRVLRHGRLLEEGVAANDVVLGHGALARLVNLHVRINNEPLGILRSDGIIICSPLGSSGYSVSAGGSMLYADMNAIGLTPVCPFSSSICPLIFPGETSFELGLGPDSEECYLTIDGQTGRKVEKNDLVRVWGWTDALSFFGDNSRFFSRLRARINSAAAAI